MAKRTNGVAEFTLNGSSLEWKFPKMGALQISAKSFFGDWDKLDDVQQKIIINGLKQKCADGMASAANETERFERMQAIMLNLLSGVWSARGTGASSDAAILAQAISEIDRKPLSKCREYVDGLTKAAREALMAHPLYKTTCDELRAQRSADVDVDSEIEAIRNL